MKILIVEDEKGIRDLLVKRLKKHYSVDACEDGESALDYIRVYTYDAIVLDIMLPKIERYPGIKTHPKCRKRCSRDHAHRQRRD